MVPVLQVGLETNIPACGHKTGQIGYCFSIGRSNEAIDARVTGPSVDTGTATMRSLANALAGLAAVMAGLLAFGFIMFAAIASRPPAPDQRKADGIVVLTGGGARIVEGGRLLRNGHGRRLLVTGVNTRTSRAEIMRLADLDEPRFACCVDLDYEALDTFGNANETREWVAAHRFKSLIVVTAGYHMPRSLAVLSEALDGVELIAHPVVAKPFRNESWWLNWRAARTLVAEYLKLLPIAARQTIGWLVTPAGGLGAVASPGPATAKAN
jgi:uncharacterized SAM-binding protein YcdF (DUF218 family)